MVKLSSLVPDLVLMVPGCPEPTMERALRDAARAFCRDTYLISELTDTTTTDPGESAVELAGLVSGQKEIVALMDVRVDGQFVGQTSIDTVRESIGFLDATTGRPRAAYQLGSQTVMLWPTPDAAYEVQFLVVTAPTSTATQLDDDLGNRWSEAVVNKAATTLMLQPGKPYSNPQLAMVTMQSYKHDVDRARIEFNRSYGRNLHVDMRGVSFV